MPNTKQCAKRLRQDKKKQARNNFVKRTIKTLGKKMKSDIPVEEKENLIKTVYSEIDRAVKKGVIHKRTAARRKSRITNYLNKQKTSQKAESSES